jgi:hypothetical protein
MRGGGATIGKEAARLRQGFDGLVAKMQALAEQSWEMIAGEADNWQGICIEWLILGVEWGIRGVEEFPTFRLRRKVGHPRGIRYLEDAPPASEIFSSRFSI